MLVAAAFLGNQAHKWFTLDFFISSHAYRSAFGPGR